MVQWYRLEPSRLGQGCECKGDERGCYEQPLFVRLRFLPFLSLAMLELTAYIRSTPLSHDV